MSKKVSYEPVIKWSGSKRYAAEKIISYLPEKICTYYEPFLGGGSVFFRLLNSDIEVERFICSDVCEPLIEFFVLLQNSPDYVYDVYRYDWETFQTKGDEYYYEIRDRFNRSGDPTALLFLSRTAQAGLIRFNKAGKFNSSVHHGRPGIHPDRFYKICESWSSAMRDRDIVFRCDDYRSIASEPEDFMFIDPPYANTKGLYYGGIDQNAFYDWLRSQRGGYAMTYDGTRGGFDFVQDVPADLYQEHIMLSDLGAPSPQNKLKGIIEQVAESLYIKKS